eukprot:Opistho-1_new@4199
MAHARDHAIRAASLGQNEFLEAVEHRNFGRLAAMDLCLEAGQPHIDLAEEGDEAPLRSLLVRLNHKPRCRNAPAHALVARRQPLVADRPEQHIVHAIQVLPRQADHREVAVAVEGKRRLLRDVEHARVLQHRLDHARLDDLAQPPRKRRRVRVKGRRHHALRRHVHPLHLAHAHEAPRAALLRHNRAVPRKCRHPQRATMRVAVRGTRARAGRRRTRGRRLRWRRLLQRRGARATRRRTADRRVADALLGLGTLKGADVHRDRDAGRAMEGHAGAHAACALEPGAAEASGNDVRRRVNLAEKLLENAVKQIGPCTLR